MRGRLDIRRVPAFFWAAVLTPTGLGVLHLHLTRSEPFSKQVLAAPPAEVRLWFSETPEAALTSISLLRPDSTRVPLDSVRAVDDSSVSAAVKGEMDPGTYTVLWRTSSNDGHVVRGRFSFAYARDSVAKASNGAP